MVNRWTNSIESIEKIIDEFSWNYLLESIEYIEDNSTNNSIDYCLSLFNRCEKKSSWWDHSMRTLRADIIAIFNNSFITTTEIRCCVGKITYFQCHTSTSM
jgi:hypothetical protein